MSLAFQKTQLGENNVTEEIRGQEMHEMETVACEKYKRIMWKTIVCEDE